MKEYPGKIPVSFQRIIKEKTYGDIPESSGEHQEIDHQMREFGHHGQQCICHERILSQKEKRYNHQYQCEAGSDLDKTPEICKKEHKSQDRSKYRECNCQCSGYSQSFTFKLLFEITFIKIYQNLYRFTRQYSS